jgi:Fungal specific transcription factor domain
MICHYAVSIRVSKESMRADIEQLRTYRRMSENLLGFLALGEQSDLILQRLREGHRVEDISISLDTQAAVRESSPNDSSFWPPSSESSRKGSWSTAMSSSSEEESQKSAKRVKRSRYAGPISRTEAADQRPRNSRNWTSVTTNQELIEHLLLLYFCWEYPTFACLSKRYFLEDFRTGRPRYCSSLLVNAILCLGCRFSDQLDIGVNPEQFYAEAESLWAMEQDNPSLTTIQAVNLMSNWEASCGRENRSWFFARQSISMAVEMGLHAESDSCEMSTTEYEVRSTTFWGAFALDQ